MKLKAAVFMLIFISFVGISQASAEIDRTKIYRGIVGARYQSAENKRLMVIMNKDDQNLYYELNSYNVFDYYPLQLGNGGYKLSIMENTTGDKYRFVSSDDLSFSTDDPNKVFLNSIQLINFNVQTLVVRRAYDITHNLKTDALKIAAIHDYVTKTYKYDYNKLNNIPQGYFPVLDTLVSQKSGICYDYSAIMCAMLRSIGIPTKMVMGFTPNISGYHAWNEAYDKDTGRWIVIDSTYDAAMYIGGVGYTLEKSRSLYIDVKYYY